jgi:hypothetical protein
MSAVESAVVLFPRFTTLAGATTFLTPPLDVSRFGGAQLQFWWASYSGTVTGYLDESLDGVEWPVDATTEIVMTGAGSPKFLSVGFRLRWFRMRIVTQSSWIMLWCEGILRAGGGGSQAWARPGAAGSAPAGAGTSFGRAMSAEAAGLPVHGRSVSSDADQNIQSPDQKALQKALGGG